MRPRRSDKATLPCWRRKLPPWVGKFRYHGLSPALTFQPAESWEWSNFHLFAQISQFCRKYGNQSKASKDGSVAAQCPLTIHPDGWVKHFTNFWHDGLSYSAVLRVCWKQLVLDRVLYPTNDQPTNPIKTLHPIHQPINQSTTGLKVEWTITFEGWYTFLHHRGEAVPKGRENTLKCQVGLKGLFWWGINSISPQSRAQPKNPSSSLPVTFLSKLHIYPEMFIWKASKKHQSR